MVGSGGDSVLLIDIDTYNVACETFVVIDNDDGLLIGKDTCGVACEAFVIIGDDGGSELSINISTCSAVYAVFEVVDFIDDAEDVL